MRWRRRSARHLTLRPSAACAIAVAVCEPRIFGYCLPASPVVQNVIDFGVIDVMNSLVAESAGRVGIVQCLLKFQRKGSRSRFFVADEEVKSSPPLISTVADTVHAVRETCNVFSEFTIVRHQV